MLADCADRAAEPPSSSAPTDVAESERLQFIAAAERILAGHGWWGFNVNSVLKEAHLSTRCFYRHFDSNRSLMTALLEKELQAVCGHLEEACRPDLTPTQRVWSYVDALIDRAFDARSASSANSFAPQFRSLLADYPENHDHHVRTLAAPLAAALDAARAVGEARPGDPEADAVAVLYLVGSMITDRPRRNSEERERGEVRRVVVPLMVRALRLQEPGPSIRQSKEPGLDRQRVGDHQS